MPVVPAHSLHYKDHLCLYYLCLYSIFGAIRTGSYMTYILMTKGLKQSVCDQSFYNGPVSKFWAYAFVLSKAPELGKSRRASDMSNIFCAMGVILWHAKTWKKPLLL